MAITLDDLLGLKRTSQNTEQEMTFPSWDEVQNRNRVSANNNATPYTVERPAIRPYNENAQMNFEQPVSSEYKPRYNMYGQTSEQVQDFRTRNSYFPEQTQRVSAPARPEERKPGYYQMGISDLSPNEPMALEAKLNYNSNARVEDAAENVERVSIFTNVKSEHKKETSKRAKLSTKGKILFAVYFAVVILVAVLIIVNAGDLNRGTATTPSSSVSGVVGDAPQSHILADYAIDCEYGTAFNIK
ncbi:MAG: hypothetical protein MJ193_00220 [Clostridia bacterium]|nr:hypothetical protein [Clostridia bacterium]